MLAAAKDGPKPLYSTGGGVAPKSTWFNHKEFMTWWRTKKAKPE
jgi:hypothetical protein